MTARGVSRLENGEIIRTVFLDASGTSDAGRKQKVLLMADGELFVRASRKG